LVSHSWGTASRARNEIICLLRKLGDDSPVVRRTIAKGITGVKTKLDPPVVVAGLRLLYQDDPSQFQFTYKWVPIDAWAPSEIEAIKAEVSRLKERILRGERWRMIVEKRRFTKYHKIQIITSVADLIDEKVDLKNPDKILMLQILGNQTGVAVLRPGDIFSVSGA